MSIGNAPATASKKMFWAGWVVSALPILAFAMSGGMKVTAQQPVVEGFQHFGYPPSAVVPIGVVELAGMVLYAIPQTSGLGAILLTAFLGGAVATHVRAAEPFWGPIVLGVLVWLGLLFRDPRWRALLPLRR